MSSTNRGGKRHEADFYPTPPEPIEKFLTAYSISTDCRILEPCAGNGSIIKSLRKFGCENIDAVEIRGSERPTLEEVADTVYIGDYLTMDGLKGKYDFIITNPPFKLAQKFIEKSLDIIKPGGTVIMLLRTNFLESKSRFEFWQKNPLSRLYVLSKRPSFTGKGTDSTSYSWFVWERDWFPFSQTIEVI